MASQGPLFPSAAVNFSSAPESAEAWVNPTNVFSDNGVEASITAATFDTPDISQQLVTSGYGFTIPSGSTIDGIIVEIERRDAAIGAASDNRVQLRNASGTLVGTNKADLPTDWPTAAAIKTYGSSVDTWTASPTDVMVNDPDFGVVLSVQADAANTDIFVDFIRITVHYTPPAEPPAITGSGDLVATLGSSMSGTAVQKFVGSGTPATSLGSTMSGTAVETFTGSGSFSRTLDASMTGSATMTPDAPSPITGSGDLVATLGSSIAATAVQTFVGSGAPATTLTGTMSGAAVETFVGSGDLVSSLGSSMTGAATMTPDGGEPPPPEEPPAVVGGRMPRFIFVDEEEKKPESLEEVPSLVVTKPEPENKQPAESRSAPPPIPVTLEIAKVRQQKVLAVAQKAGVARSVQQLDESDEEDAILQILMAL